MDNVKNQELQQFVDKYNSLIKRNSKQGDLRYFKYINADGVIKSIQITIDKHLRRQNCVRIQDNILDEILEESLTDED
jgi:hypothetical protein